MGTHQHLAAVGAELTGAEVQRHREMRAAVAVTPYILAATDQHQRLGAAVQFGVQRQGATIGDGVQRAEGVHPRSSGLPRPQFQGRISMCSNSPART
ncbi:hypothetical protein D3C84_1089050 [compost metagenome]